MGTTSKDQSIKTDREIKPLYIFDIDGTLAFIEHRLNILKEENNPDKWKDFYKKCGDDKPNLPIISIMQRLALTGADIWFFTGRTEDVRDLTVEWLCKNTFDVIPVLPERLIMRQNGDFTPDHVLKEQWLNNMLDEDRNRLAAIFDDRDRVVEMWRNNGITCLQVAPGKF